MPCSRVMGYGHHAQPRCATPRRAPRSTAPPQAHRPGPDHHQPSPRVRSMAGDRWRRAGHLAAPGGAAHMQGRRPRDGSRACGGRPRLGPPGHRHTVRGRPDVVGSAVADRPLLGQATLALCRTVTGLATGSAPMWGCPHTELRGCGPPRGSSHEPPSPTPAHVLNPVDGYEAGHRHRLISFGFRLLHLSHPHPHPHPPQHIARWSSSGARGGP